MPFTHFRFLPPFLPFLDSLYGLFLKGLLLARLVYSDSSTFVVYPATSFTDAFDPSICIGIDSVSILYLVTSSANALNRPECADIEVFGMPPFVQMSR